MMLIVKILLIIIGIKLKTWKQTENCREKRKIPAANSEIGCGEIENILKTAGFILFFLKKIAHSPAKFQKVAEKVGIKLGKPH